MNHNFRNLEIWKEGMEITSETYRLVGSFPDCERYSLSSQMTRSAVSIPSNIAEGTSKSSSKDFNRYLEHSLGSAFELETQLGIAYKENYIEVNTFNQSKSNLISLQKKIYKFKEKIKQPGR